MPMELHHSVRERFGDTLCYHFLSFGGTYVFDEVRRHIFEFFQREEVTSFALFELFGAVDIVIRAWMPIGKVNLFDRKLADYFAANGWTMSNYDSFRVSANRYHYLWPEGPPGAQEALLDN